MKISLASLVTELLSSSYPDLVLRRRSARTRSRRLDVHRKGELLPLRLRSYSSHRQSKLTRVLLLLALPQFDWICNSSGNYIWTDALEWSGHDEFSSQKLRDWHVDGEVAGQTRSAKGLTCEHLPLLSLFTRIITDNRCPTFVHEDLTVNGAGHMASPLLPSFESSRRSSTLTDLLPCLSLSLRS